MCIIIDANFASDMSAHPAEPRYRLVREWIQQPEPGVRLVYGGALGTELKKIHWFRNQLVEWDRAGKSKPFTPVALAPAARALRQGGLCKSKDDFDTLALALVSGARTLCLQARADKALAQDFKNPKIISPQRGGVYETDKHRHLLSHTEGCPAWNGLPPEAKKRDQRRRGRRR
ncbi:MAG: hypothetical protein HY719_06420 [Planctomycetes bacterium]|nr:hypothetical protein [Planctomycetota bacterium]